MRLASIARRATWTALLALLASVGPGGCRDGTPSDETNQGEDPSKPTAAESALRVAFPAKAGAVLEQRDAFVALGEGFAASGASRRDGLGVTLPSRGSGAVRFVLPDGFGVGVRETGTNGDGVQATHAVAYDRVGGAAYWTANEAGYEEWLRTDAGAASPDRPVAVWEIDGAAPVQVGAWVEVRNAEGTTRLRVDAPVAWTASGAPVDARLVVRGAAIELWVDGGGEAVLVDPQWTAAATMASPHAFHSATLLQNGNVLVASGYGASGATATSEVYNPAANSWTTVGNVSTPTVDPVAALLPSGEVLIAGGYNGAGTCLANAELYNPTTATWTAVASMSSVRCAATGVLLPSGNVLVAGGENASAAAAATAEGYDPATNTRTHTGR